MHVPELSRMGAHAEIETIPLFVTVLKNFLAHRLWQPSACISKPGAGWLYCGRDDGSDRIYHIDRGYERIEDKLRA